MHQISRKVGFNIRKIREFRGFGQEALADHLGMSVPTFAKIESGERSATVQELWTIADYLNTSPDTLLQMDEKMVFNNPNWANGTFTVNNGVPDKSKDQLFERLMFEMMSELRQLRQDVNGKK